MKYHDLRDFLRQLEALGELKRVGIEVDPKLEMTEICDRVLRAGGPALLFEKPKGHSRLLERNAVVKAKTVSRNRYSPKDVFARQVAPIFFKTIWRQMKGIRILSVILFTTFSAYALAEGFGIRFVVDDTSLQSPESRDLMVRNLNQKVKDLNAIYRESQVDLTANIVDIQFSTMQDRDLTVILQKMQAKKGAFTDFVAKANQYGADFTVAIVPRLQTLSYWQSGKRNICGAAHGNWNLQDLKSVETSYAVINPSCGTSSLAHELGHLMGVNHGIAMTRCFPDKKEGVPITPYAFGYSEGECNGKPSPEKFGDIMTGGLMQFIDGSLKWMNIFSNPRIRRPECGARGICGDPDFGDAARALNENAKFFVKHRAQKR